MKKFRVKVAGEPNRIGTAEQIYNIFPDVLNLYFLLLPDVDHVEFTSQGIHVILEEVN